MKAFRLRRDVGLYEKIPAFYFPVGWEGRYVRCYPFGIHFVMRWCRLFSQWYFQRFRHTALERRLNCEWSGGYKVGLQNGIGIGKDRVLDLLPDDLKPIVKEAVEQKHREMNSA